MIENFYRRRKSEAAAIIRDHAARGAALAIVGGNTRAGFGNAVAAETILKFVWAYRYRCL